jgi:hypothetical protein
LGWCQFDPTRPGRGRLTEAGFPQARLAEARLPEARFAQACPLAKPFAGTSEPHEARDFAAEAHRIAGEAER